MRYSDVLKYTSIGDWSASQNMVAVTVVAYAIVLGGVHEREKWSPSLDAFEILWSVNKHLLQYGVKEPISKQMGIFPITISRTSKG
jgi:hypothetical protein